MQLGCSRLTPVEQYCRLAAGECLYCGQKDNFISIADKRSHLPVEEEVQVGKLLSKNFPPPLTIPAKLQFKPSLSHSAF